MLACVFLVEFLFIIWSIIALINLERLGLGCWAVCAHTQEHKMRPFVERVFWVNSGAYVHELCAFMRLRGCQFGWFTRGPHTQLPAGCLLDIRLFIPFIYLCILLVHWGKRNIYHASLSLVHRITLFYLHRIDLYPLRSRHWSDDVYVQTILLFPAVVCH